jgi:hypothetical protein
MAIEADEPGMDLGSNLKDPLDHDKNGKKGGSLPKAKRDAQKKAHGVRKSDEPGKWIILDDNDDIPPTGLYLGHNGVGHIIKSGEPVFVYDYLIEILDHAIMSAPEINPNTRQVNGYRDRLRYSYRVVPAPIEEE